jgi:hypothetical protein
MKVKTDKIALGILALYGVYGIFAIPFVYLMLSLAIGLIVYSTSDSIEFTVVAVLLTGVLSVLISQTRRPEGFVDRCDTVAILFKTENLVKPAVQFFETVVLRSIFCH